MFPIIPGILPLSFTDGREADFLHHLLTLRQCFIIILQFVFLPFTSKKIVICKSHSADSKGHTMNNSNYEGCP
jgi:hypothetical protein